MRHWVSAIIVLGAVCLALPALAADVTAIDFEDSVYEVTSVEEGTNPVLKMPFVPVPGAQPGPAGAWPTQGSAINLSLPSGHCDIEGYPLLYPSDSQKTITQSGSTGRMAASTVEGVMKTVWSWPSGA